MLGNKIKYVKKKSNSYIGRNAYFCFKASDWTLAVDIVVFLLKICLFEQIFLNITENALFY